MKPAQKPADLCGDVDCLGCFDCAYVLYAYRILDMSLELSQ